ncbi:carbon-nitrogen hydrolase family protein [Pseudomonas sp. 10B1]|nr:MULTISPECIES: carbon-nitrogen hydrolase family protein [unclassified Pseudomonas]MDY7561280.1 carbon-nitrogen hydrolase family protein [Pseudomonas sp. AB6]MEA9977022.1 carbon-nitrogen hydrolase family protein [Pseudomonas sp. RTS4]MEA9997361.1 carbon-nitrogen hydrolase family protein [Pseudomonas sp. AA4]MEB0087709.1 carbon-nitrogen hydrolase family protein [Pseudomonas sp. RTI1]MEB0127710.1 carbon-nitrogen hydrolase family protein [Pseudomonas sp. CCC1.2]
MIISYAVWTGQRPVGLYLSDLRIQLTVNEGQPREHGNLLGIQTELSPSDYQSRDHLRRKLAAYLQQARDLGLINSKTIVILPEHVGTWLFVSGEKDQLYQSTTVKEAMNWLSVSNPLRFLYALYQAKGRNRFDDAYLRMNAQAMARDYQTLFGGLAKTFGVTLVAGSIVLPDPSISEGQLHIGSGALYNSSVVFGSDGLPIGQPQRQVYPSFTERDYIKPAANTDLNVIDTPAGRLGVLVGSDSWYPDNYAQLNAKGAELIAVPAFVAGNGLWSKPWRGFRSASTPASTSLKPGEISEGDAWHQLTLTGVEPASTAHAGLSVFMRGQFWDKGSSGHSFASRHSLTGGDQFSDDQPGHIARLINLWL